MDNCEDCDWTDICKKVISCPKALYGKRRAEMTEPIIAKFMLPITTKETVQELMQQGCNWGKTIGAIEELEKVEEKIDFEEKWLIDIKMNNGFISIADIEVAMSGIRSVIAELKGEQK